MNNAILIVEDTDDDLFFLKRALTESDLHHPLRVAVDGRQAIDYLQGNGVYANREEYPVPFLVLLDLKLPYIMGLEVLKWMRQQPQYKETLVVVLTSSPADSDRAETFRLGGNDYIVKPPTRVKLREMVERLRHKWIEP
jgi:two-component system response regulator